MTEATLPKMKISGHRHCGFIVLTKCQDSGGERRKGGHGSRTCRVALSSYLTLPCDIGLETHSATEREVLPASRGSSARAHVY